MSEQGRLQVIQSVDDLFSRYGSYGRPDSAYVVSAQVLDELDRRWSLCIYLADALHRVEVEREKRQAQLHERRSDEAT